MTPSFPTFRHLAALGRVLAAVPLIALGSILPGPIAPLTAWSPEARADSPGLDALDEFRKGKQAHKAVENRFFLKEHRFEFAPVHRGGGPRVPLQRERRRPGPGVLFAGPRRG